MAPQLRRLALPLGESLATAIADFDCLGSGENDDPVAENVQGFITDHRFVPGIEHDFSSTYLFVDEELSPRLVGYVTLTFGAVRLTKKEKTRIMEELRVGEFGALRIQMIGVDCRHQGQGLGVALLESVTGLARELSKTVAVRFILADANLRKVDWYEARGFVSNVAQKETDRVDPKRVVSMRLDLLETSPAQ